MDKINFCVIKITPKNAVYSESEYKIEADEKGDKWIKSVHYWDGIIDLQFEGTQINFAWVK